MTHERTPRYKELRPGHLRAFRELVRRKSFSAAALALGIAQPTLWEQVRALEHACGAVLVERHGREWTPTEDGLLALELASSIVDALDSFTDIFQQQREILPRQLVLSSVNGPLTEDLAEPIVSFCQAHPHIHLLLPSYHGISTEDLLLIGDADLGCVVQPHDAPPVANPLLRRESLLVRPAALMLPSGHPLVTQTRVRLADLVHYPLILPGPEALWRRRIDDVFRNAGLLEHLQIVLDATPTHAARRYVSLGLGIALFPLPRDPLQYPQLHIRLVDDLLPAEDVVLIWRRAGRLRPQAQLFMDFIRERLAAERK